MSPDQLDTAINFVAWTHWQIGTYGPGVLLVAGAWVLVRTWRWTGRRLAVWREQRDWRHSTDDDGDLAHMLRLSALLDQQPLIPRRHGQDDDALADCQAIWNTDTVEEDR